MRRPIHVHSSEEAFSINYLVETDIPAFNEKKKGRKEETKENRNVALLAISVHSGAPAAEGRQAEPHTHIRKLKGTHELIFSCVSWLAVLLVGAYARRRRRRRRWWSRATWRPQLTRKPKRGFSFRGLSL